MVPSKAMFKTPRKVIPSREFLQQVIAAEPLLYFTEKLVESIVARIGVKFPFFGQSQRLPVHSSLIFESTVTFLIPQIVSINTQLKIVPLDILNFVAIGKCLSTLPILARINTFVRDPVLDNVECCKGNSCGDQADDDRPAIAVLWSILGLKKLASHNSRTVSRHDEHGHANGTLAG